MPRIRGPSKRPPLKITVERSPLGPGPMCRNVSMSHSRWKRNWREGVGRRKLGLVQVVDVRVEIECAGSTVPGFCGRSLGPFEDDIVLARDVYEFEDEYRGVSV